MQPRGRGGRCGRGGGGGRGDKSTGRGGAKSRGGSKAIIEPHRYDGIFIAKGKEPMLVTKHPAPGESVYGDKRILIDIGSEDGTIIEYTVWNSFWRKLAVGVLGGIDKVFDAPGAKVSYLGGASRTSDSHVADVVAFA